MFVQFYCIRTPKQTYILKATVKIVHLKKEIVFHILSNSFRQSVISNQNSRMRYSVQYTELSSHSLCCLKGKNKSKINIKMHTFHVLFSQNQ